MKLQLLIPQYNEDDNVIKPMLDSLALQQNVDFNEFGVIIVNDGSDVKLSESLLKSYQFKIEYYQNEHKGVSATRNACLDKSTADYVMFCDADDMFHSLCGLYMIMREIELGFDSMVSQFTEESKDPLTDLPIYINHDLDSTFVHGKIHRRQYLIDKEIRWNENLTIHEDSYFNIQCQKLSQNVKYCPQSFYLWKWRDNSVCRHDPKYILKTYNNMLDSSTELIKEFLRKKHTKEAQQIACAMIYDAYFTMNKDEWINQDNKEYRNNTELRFKQYYNDFNYLVDAMLKIEKAQVIMGIKNRFFQEGLLMESITFDDWIKHIQEL